MSDRADKRIINPQIRAEIVDEESGREVKVIDISRKGMRFCVGDAFEPGHKLWFRLHINDDNGADYAVRVRVKIKNNFGKKDQDLYHYGVRFISVSSWYATSCLEKHVIYKKKAGQEEHKGKRQDRMESLNEMHRMISRHSRRAKN